MCEKVSLRCTYVLNIVFRAFIGTCERGIDVLSRRRVFE